MFTVSLPRAANGRFMAGISALSGTGIGRQEPVAPPAFE
jgi:hypothetical protein